MAENKRQAYTAAVSEALTYLTGEVREAVGRFCGNIANIPGGQTSAGEAAGCQNAGTAVGAEPEEIRLRAGLPLSVTADGKNMFLTKDGRATVLGDRVICRQSDMQYAVRTLSEGSIYRYMPTICEGYIITSGGLRVGICGRSVYSDGHISAVEDFTALNLRIPHNILGCADALYRRLSDKLASVLIFSPPGEGKTTFARDLALSLSRKYRVAAVDEKCELFPPGSNFADGAGMLDILRGYRKADGIEIATRTLSPEIIICDEIGAADDIEAILSVQNSGVRLAATVHADDFADLENKPNIKRLLGARVFGLLAGLSRRGGREVSLRAVG